MASKKHPQKKITDDVLYSQWRAKIAKDGIAAGFHKFRYFAPADEIYRVAHKFAEKIIYEKFAWKQPFPKKYSEIGSFKFIEGVEFDREFAWTVRMLEINGAAISDFLDMKRIYEKAFLRGEKGNCEESLEKIRNKFGESLWIIENKINFIQEFDGLAEQKNYAKSIISDENIDSFTKYFTQIWSYRAEENVSANKFESFINNIDIDDQISSAIRPRMGKEIEFDIALAALALCAESQIPVIDRYMGFINIVSSLISTEISIDNKRVIIRGLGVLKKKIIDNRLDLMMAYLNGATVELSDSISVAILDDYTAGNYDRSYISASDAIEKDPLLFELYEILLRSEAYLCFERSNILEKPLMNRIMMAMKSIITRKSKVFDSYAFLWKVACTNASQDWSSHLRTFLWRQFSDERIGRYTSPQLSIWLQTPRITPWHLFIMPKEYSQKRNSQCSPCEGITAQLTLSIIDGNINEIQKILNHLQIAPGRRLKYAAIAYLRNQHPEKAIPLLKEAERNASKSEKYDCSKLLVTSYLATENYAEAFQKAAMLFVEDHTAGWELSIPEIINGSERIGFSSGLLSRAIIYDAYSRYYGSDKDPERADAYEDVLSHFGMDRPKDLFSIVDELPFNELIYFLRYVCVPSVIDRSLSLPSSKAVLQERLAICQKLSEIDQESYKQYSDEIKKITTQLMVMDRMRQIDLSKIYVDVPGIKKRIEKDARENWERYKALERAGVDIDHELAIEDLISRIQKLHLTDKLHLIVNVPQSERNSLFLTMVSEVYKQFLLSKEHGLDGFLGTRVRHGILVRQLRNPLQESDLVTAKDTITGRYLINERWASEVSQYSQDTQVSLQENLAKFSEEVDRWITIAGDRWVRVKSQEHPDGMFSLDIPNSELRHLKVRCITIESYDDFIDLVITFLWDLTEKNLMIIRNRLVTELKEGLFHALNVLSERVAELHIGHARHDIHDAINAGRQYLFQALDRVASWFVLPPGSEYPDYSLEDAILTSIQAVRTVASRHKLECHNNIQQNINLKGSTLTSFVHILFMLLENATKHSEIPEKIHHISISARLDGNWLQMTIANNLGKSVDIDERERKLEIIRQDYGASSINYTQNDKGSGLHKIWKVFNYDLKCSHEMDFSVLESDDDRKFLVNLRVDVEEIMV